MAKKQYKKIYIVDHANKSADRNSKNPNRSLAKRGRFRRGVLVVRPSPGGKHGDES